MMNNSFQLISCFLSFGCTLVHKLWYIYLCINFCLLFTFPLISILKLKSFELNNQHLRKPKHLNQFGTIPGLLTPGTIKIFHQSLQFPSIDQQIINSLIPMKSDRNPPNIIKIDRNFLTFSTFNTWYCLSLKNITYNWIIYLLVVIPPLIALYLILYVTNYVNGFFYGSPYSSLYVHFFVIRDSY